MDALQTSFAALSCLLLRYLTFAVAFHGSLQPGEEQNSLSLQGRGGEETLLQRETVEGRESRGLN